MKKNKNKNKNKNIEVPVLHTRPTLATTDVPDTYAATVHRLGYDPLGLVRPRKRSWLMRLSAWER